MKSNKQIIDQFYGKNGHKAKSEGGLAYQKEQDELNRGYYDGDKTAYEAELSAETKRFSVCLNRVQPLVNTYAGFAAQNRRNAEHTAIEKDDLKREQLTEIVNKSCAWVRSNANADQIETQQDIQVAICGYGAVSKALDYTRNPKGEVVYKEVTNDYYWDPQAKEIGMRDRRWEFIKTTMYLDDALAFFGGKEDDYEADLSMGAYKFDPKLGGNYDKVAYDMAGSRDKNLINVYEYHWYDLEKYWKIENPLFKEENQLVAGVIYRELTNIRELRLEEEESEEYYNFDPAAPEIIAGVDLMRDIKEVCDRYGVAFEAEENLTKVYYEAVLSGTKVFQKRKAVDQSGFNVKVKTAFYDKKNKFWHGMVSTIREPARYANKVISEFLLILAATAKPGWFYDQNKVLDISAFETRVNKSAKAIPVDGDPSAVVMPKQQAVMPNGFDTLYPEFVQAVTDASGISQEAMGLGDLSQPSYELEQLRIKQVMVTLAVYFDSITFYAKEDARSLPYYIKRLAKNNEGMTIVSNNQEGVPSITQVTSDLIMDQYAIEIAEAPDTPTRKKEQYIAINGFVDKVILSAPQLAIQALAKAAKYLPISGRERMEIIEMLTPQANPEQEAAAAKKAEEMEKIQLEATISGIEKSKAETDLKIAQAEKTRAEVEKVNTETDKANLETIAMSTTPINELNINI